MRLDRLIYPLRSASLDPVPMDQTQPKFSCIHLCRPASSARKQEWVDYVYRCFFVYSNGNSNSNIVAVTSTASASAAAAAVAAATTTTGRTSTENCCEVPLDDTNLIWTLLRNDIRRLHEMVPNTGSVTPPPYSTANVYLAAIPLPQRVSDSVCLENATVTTTHNLMDSPMDMDTIYTSKLSPKNTIHANVNANANANIHILSQKTKLKTIVHSAHHHRETNMDVANCVVCGCLDVDTELLPCGHFFHGWCLQRCRPHDTRTNQLPVQTCPIDHIHIQSTNLKQVTNDASSANCNKVW